ncbi:MAG: hypothetical protein EBU66_07440 [Bacteroidetes bacterium]|nr:hypothetical protein [bacterium]NBP64478.1 hypothetical protein [Bacteroidota bacterium]
MFIFCGPDNNRDTFELNIPEDRDIGIMLSSGADSAILLYLMCLELLYTGRSTDEIKYIFTIPKLDGAELHSANIVNWINKKLEINLPQPTIVEPENLHDLHHSIKVREGIRESFVRYDPSAKNLFLYLADQKVIPKPWPSHMVGLVEPYRVSENEHKDIIGLPFNHLNKAHTIDLHFLFKTEGLLELSHSCTERQTGRCNQCYHCNERQWAFEQLGKVDPGSN